MEKWWDRIELALAVLAPVFLLFWVFDVDFFGPYDPNLGGTAAEWVTGMVTAATVGFSVWAFLGEGRRRREEESARRRAWAGQVACSSDLVRGERRGERTEHQAKFVVSNHSPYPIHMVQIRISWSENVYSSGLGEDRASSDEFGECDLIRPGDSFSYSSERWADSAGFNFRVEWGDVFEEWWASEDGAPAELAF